MIESIIAEFPPPLFTFTENYVDIHREKWRVWFEGFSQRPVQMIEIGSFQGLSTLYFLRHVLSHPQSRIDCFDLFWKLENETRFDCNIANSGMSHKVTKHKGRSDLLLRGCPFLTADLIYIDGSHEANRRFDRRRFGLAHPETGRRFGFR